MAANLTPQYHEAEERYRAARTPAEELAALEEMWRELPKHKSSEKLQAELKKKLSAARKTLQEGGKKRSSKPDPFFVPKSGAGQVVLIGMPNVGKSAIVGGLTNAHVKIAEYPFTTALPQPGMVPYEDVQIQVVDTPPVTAEQVPPGMPGLWRSADALVLVADLSSDALLEDVEACLHHLDEREIELTTGARQPPENLQSTLKVPGFLLANKVDLDHGGDNLALLEEFFGNRLRIVAMSAIDPAQLERLPELLFRLVRVIRTYAKPPGKKPDLDEPFVLPAGSNVYDLAHKVHRGMEGRIKSARIWGHGVADGQNVHLDHVLHDKDIVELHA